jgi:hypothetical protein
VRVAWQLAAAQPGGAVVEWRWGNLIRVPDRARPAGRSTSRHPTCRAQQRRGLCGCGTGRTETEGASCFIFRYEVTVECLGREIPPTAKDLNRPSTARARPRAATSTPPACLPGGCGAGRQAAAGRARDASRTYCSMQE